MAAGVAGRLWSMQELLIAAGEALKPMANEEGHDEIGEVIQTMCEIRNAMILVGLATGENSDARSQAKAALELLAREQNLLKP